MSKSIIISIKIYDDHVDAQMIAPESLTLTDIKSLEPTEGYVTMCCVTFLSWMKISRELKKPSIVRVNDNLIFDNYSNSELKSIKQ